MFQGLNFCTGVLCGGAANFGPIGTTVRGVAAWAVSLDHHGPAIHDYGCLVLTLAAAL